MTFRCSSHAKPILSWKLNLCFQIVVLEKTLKSPLNSKEIKPVNPKGNQLWIFTERTEYSLKDWKGLDDGKDWGQEEKGVTWDAWMASLTQWTWTWANSAAAKSLQLCPTLCDPIDSSPPGSPVPGILKARTLEWVAISFSMSKLWEMVKDREAWCGGAHGVAKNWTWLSDCTTTKFPSLFQFDSFFLDLLNLVTGAPSRTMTAWKPPGSAWLVGSLSHSNGSPELRVTVAPSVSSSQMLFPSSLQVSPTLLGLFRSP